MAKRLCCIFVACMILTISCLPVCAFADDAYIMRDVYGSYAMTFQADGVLTGAYTKGIEYGDMGGVMTKYTSIQSVSCSGHDDYAALCSIQTYSVTKYEDMPDGFYVALGSAPVGFDFYFRTTENGAWRPYSEADIRTMSGQFYFAYDETTYTTTSTNRLYIYTDTNYLQIKLAVRSTSVEDENVFDGILFFPFEFLGNIPGWMTMMWEFLSLPFVVDATKIFIFLCIGAVVLKLY